MNNVAEQIRSKVLYMCQTVKTSLPDVKNRVTVPPIKPKCIVLGPASYYTLRTELEDAHCRMFMGLPIYIDNKYDNFIEVYGFREVDENPS